MPSIAYLRVPIEHGATPYHGRAWYCVSYSDHSCLHVWATSERHAREAATAVDAARSRPIVTHGTCTRTGAPMPTIRR